MSRCFVYPPPGYNPGNLSGTVNIESINRKMKKSAEKTTNKIKMHRKLERKDDVIIPEEASGITEEHGYHYSSDHSTENSLKRKRQCGKPDSETTSHTSSSRRAEKKKREMADEYREIVENWTPPALGLLIEIDCDDDDWLFGSKKRRENPAAASANTCCSSSSSLWPPRAQFLPEDNVFALPYVVPF